MNNTSTLWEEKNSTDQSMKFESRVIFGQNDIIKNIKTKSNESVCNDIGMTSKLMRTCPKCNAEIYYTTNRAFSLANKNNSNCKKCVRIEACKIKNNYIGKKFGSLTIITQYYLNGGGHLRVDIKCDCGNIEVNKVFRNLKNRKECIKCSRQLPIGETAFNTLFYNYTRSAKERGLDFNLTKEEFRKITKQNCYYCGSAPYSVMTPSADVGEYIYSGIDRQNNDIGYTTKNCVSCCKNCNFFKFQLTAVDFINHVNKIYEYQKSKQL